MATFMRANVSNWGWASGRRDAQCVTKLQARTPSYAPLSERRARSPKKTSTWMKVCELASLVWGLGPRADSECPEADRQVHVFDSQRDFYGIHLEFCALSALARAE